MPSTKRKKSSLPSSSKNSSKLSTKSHNPLKKPTQSESSNSLPESEQPPFQPIHIIPPDREPLLEKLNPLIPDPVTRFRFLNTKTLEGAGQYSPYKPYAVAVGYQGNEDEPEACKVAVLALYPGITLDQARRAAELLVEKLPKSKSKGGQTSYNLKLRMTIRSYFLKIAQDESYITRLHAPGKKPETLPRSKNRRGGAICRAIAGHLGVSEIFVKKLYRAWLDEQGQPKKIYQIYPTQTDR